LRETHPRAIAVLREREAKSPGEVVKLCAQFAGKRRPIVEAVGSLECIPPKQTRSGNAKQESLYSISIWGNF
jgi:hypothetical protein